MLKKIPTRALCLGMPAPEAGKPQRTDLSRPGCSDRIVGREAGAAVQFKHVDELWLEPEVLHRVRRDR